MYNNTYSVQQSSNNDSALEESDDVLRTMKIKQEMHRVEIRKKKLTEFFQFSRLKISSNYDRQISEQQFQMQSTTNTTMITDSPQIPFIGNPTLNSPINVSDSASTSKPTIPIKSSFSSHPITKALKNDEALLEKLQELKSKFAVNDFNACADIVGEFLPYCIANRDKKVIQQSIYSLNQTDFPILLVMCIRLEILRDHSRLFTNALKIMQNIPMTIATMTTAESLALTDRLIENLAIDRLLDILRNDSSSVDHINCALHALANFSSTNEVLIKQRLLILKALSTIERLHSIDACITGVTFFYQCFFGNISLTLDSFSEEETNTCKRIVFFLMNCLRNAFEMKDESKIEVAIWGLQGLAKLQVLIEFDCSRDYALLMNIGDSYCGVTTILPLVRLINALCYNSDRNVEELIANDLLAYLKEFTDSHSYSIRLNCVYALLNVAASQLIEVKKVLLDRVLIVKLLRMMVDEKQKTMQEQCAYFFSNWLFEADSILIVRAVQDFEYFSIVNQILVNSELKTNNDVVLAVLKTVNYILDMIEDERVALLVIKSIQSIPLILVLDNLIGSSETLISEKAHDILISIDRITIEFNLQEFN